MITIAGAGIIGLSIAFELARRGCEVRVLEAGEPARAASWAAAGMLAPFTESLDDPHMRALCEESLALYPEFAANVRTAGRADAQLRCDGILSVAFSAEQLDRLSDRAAALRARGVDAQMLTRDQTLQLEPALSKFVRGALLVAAEGQIDNRRLGRALLAACAQLGVRVETGLRVQSIEFDSRSVLGVRTDRGYAACEAVVNACGAWSGELAGVPQQCVPPVRPVKGQMLSIALPAGFMRRVVWVPGAYCVPRGDGRLLVGATVEEAGDTRVTAGGLHMLLDAAVQSAPALADFAVSETWAGVRPGTPDAMPVLGATPRQGYFLATGHYRNGILLAPVTARLLADAVQGGHPQALKPFGVQRFSQRSQTA